MFPPPPPPPKKNKFKRKIIKKQKENKMHNNPLDFGKNNLSSRQRPLISGSSLGSINKIYTKRHI